jgi:hypothetical protein
MKELPQIRLPEVSLAEVSLPAAGAYIASREIGAKPPALIRATINLIRYGMRCKTRS